MDTKIETIDYKGYTIEIHVDEDPVHPREDWDNLGTMVSKHKRYDFNDKNAEYDVDSIPFDDVIALPLYLYDHSGLTMNTTGFECQWDSGQVGWIYVTKSKALSEYSWDELTPERIKKIQECLRSEVQTFDHFLTGAVYGYIVKDKDGEEVHSCWGYFGYDHEKSGLLPDAKSNIDAEVDRIEKNEGVQQELFN